VRGWWCRIPKHAELRRAATADAAFELLRTACRVDAMLRDRYRATFCHRDPEGSLDGSLMHQREAALKNESACLMSRQYTTQVTSDVQFL
jgi:hypothetical protein